MSAGAPLNLRTDKSKPSRGVSDTNVWSVRLPLALTLTLLLLILTLTLTLALTLILAPNHDHWSVHLPGHLPPTSICIVWVARTQGYRAKAKQPPTRLTH